ncbi:class I SAM-dependent methyltransferase [Actinoplanes sp. NPDC051859]|uniref:class I SAM-dependent methyltransferase n=1 Tax=Actinoplanes sp. NPDC051859 TaxID=3363909 RepID=UPI003796C288
MAHTHLGELLELDAAVLHEYYTELLDWIGAQLPDRPHIVDLGAGTGVGSRALARHLPTARITAVDVDAEMLAHLRHRAADDNLEDRIHTVRADLDQPWPELEPADLIWASASLHHLSDPAAALTQAYALTRPGGLFAVVELDSFPRFLADPADAALEDRCQDLLAAKRLEHGLHMGEAWGTRLAAAGYTVTAERQFDLVLRPPLPAQTTRYAQLALTRMRHGLEDRLSVEELAALDRLAADLPHRADLTVRAERTVWLARRPA